MLSMSQGNRLAGLAALSAGLLPAIAIIEEFVAALHPMVLLAYLYLIALLCFMARQAGIWATPLQLSSSTNQNAEAEQNTALHLAVLAVGVGGFFGILIPILDLNRGAWLSHLVAPDQLEAFKSSFPLIDPDKLEYLLAPLLWLVAWRVAVYVSRGKVDLNLGWRWKPIDAVFLLGLGALTWLALTIYASKAHGAHEKMHVFGVEQGTVPAWIYVGLGLIFAVINALSEELWFRSLILGSLRGLMGMWPAILLQGISFGIMHWFGFPRGIAGVLLAGAWGILLGWWTYTRRCLWQAMTVPVLADFAIWYLNNA